MHLPPDPMTHKVANHAIAAAFTEITDCIANLMQMMACSGVLDSFKERIFRDLDQLLLRFRNLSDRISPCGIRVEAVIYRAEIHAHYVPFFKNPLL